MARYRKREKRVPVIIKIMICLCILAALAFGAEHFLSLRSRADTGRVQQAEETAAGAEAAEEQPWQLVLVNRTHPLSENCDPELTELKKS